jgi:hypothetical protein
VTGTFFDWHLFCGTFFAFFLAPFFSAPFSYLAVSGIDWRAAEPVMSYLGDVNLVFADGFESGSTGAWIVH